jgi:plasmid stability protein
VLDIIASRCDDVLMRTTINLDEDVLRAVRSRARERGESLGAVISELIREALRPPDELRYSADFPVFAVRENAPPITPEMVDAAMEEA